MKKILLTRGMSTMVDDEDFEKFGSLKWHVTCTGKNLYYAYHNRRVLLHRLIMGAEKGQIVDHINHDTLDNRKCNLRLVTPAQSQQNRSVRTAKRGSKYKGVKRADNGKSWSARITMGRKQTYLGSFKTEIDAAKAYDEAALRMFGEYAYLNFSGE